jgi:hypothetical protein
VSSIWETMASVSEYQWYEFVALDRPLTAKEMGELRAISTRAEITPTRFWNEYQWGDLKADPAELLARHFDVHLYFANWGTRRLMFRLPRRAVDLKVLEAYAPGGAATLTTRGDHVILDLYSETDEPDDDWFEGGHLAASLTPLRADLLAGDHRAAYLAWLLAIQAGDVDDDEPEPPVPAGLATGAAGLAALAEFLCLDRDLLTAATTASPAAVDDTGRFTDWVRGLPPREQQRWLLRAAADPDLRVGAALLGEFRRAHPPAAGRSQRTVADLLAGADALREERDRQAERQAEQARAAAAAAEQARLDELARRGDAAWQELEQLVETRAYDQAVRLVLDLRQIAVRAGELAAFDGRIAGLRQRYARRRGFLDRLGRAAADRTASGSRR